MRQGQSYLTRHDELECNAPSRDRELGEGTHFLS